MAPNLETERRKALDFLAGRADVKLEKIPPTVRSDKETEDVIVSQEKKEVIKEIINPRLRTEAYLKEIGKL